MEDKTSMMFWYPKILKLPVKKPRTVIIPNKGGNVVPKLEGDYFSQKGLEKNFDLPLIRKTCKKIGLPIFIRTDQTSGKHSWNETCYLTKIKALEDHINELACFSQLAGFDGIPFNAVVLREYIPMNNLFTAFYSNMPVNPEYRVFIRDGKVECFHWYWIDEAIEGHEPSIQHWKDKLERAKEQTEKDIDKILKMAKVVAKEFKGYWSVDFCQTKHMEWLLIDMAEGGVSWHPFCDKKVN